jgi:hypothetical protein
MHREAAIHDNTSHSSGNFAPFFLGLNEVETKESPQPTSRSANGCAISCTQIRSKYLPGICRGGKSKLSYQQLGRMTADHRDRSLCAPEIVARLGSSP